MFDPLMERESPRLVQQCIRQSQPSSENPQRWRAPTVINGRIAGPGDSDSEPCDAIHLFRNKLDAELFEQSSRMCFPNSPMPFTDSVLLWGDGGCRHELATQVFELLSDFSLEFLLLGRKSTVVARQKESSSV